jgi:DNA-binding LytR/AlgR family response regulator
MRYTVLIGWITYFFAIMIIALFKLSTNSKVKKNFKKEIDIHLPIKDESGKTILAIKPENILYIKSEDNYTSVVFLENDKVAKKLIRISITKLQNQLLSPGIMRIHRSYIVNLKNVSSVNREKGDYQIRMTNLPDTSIKVSNTYKKTFKQAMDL